MNQNYVRKCEEYLQNIPSQKLAPSSLAGSNLSSRKLTQKPGPPVSSLRQGRQSINNLPPPPPVPPPPTEGSRSKPKPPPPPTMTGRRTPFRSPTVSSGSAGQQQGSKFIRPCCRPKGGGGGAVGRRGSDNVNQNVDVGVMDGTDGGGGGGGEGTTGRKTKTWDGILAEVAKVETVKAPLSQIKSKLRTPSPPEPAPITSTFPEGTVQPQHSLVPNPSVTSLSTTVTSSSVAVRPTSSSIAAVPPQPRLPSTTSAPEHVHRKPSSTSTTEPAENQLQLQGINLFRFDPLRTLQFLTLELKSKLKPLLTTTVMADDATSVHKQLYKISKELLYAVKILTENATQQQPAAKTTCNCCCQPHDKVTSVGKNSSKPTISGDSERSFECLNCLKLQTALDRLRAEQSCLPRTEINCLQDPRPPEDSSKASSATDQLQLQLRLEGEIKRLQTMISDKQTTPTATAEGLIGDLNRKLDETTHARDEAQRKLLYATLENERLNFLLRSQCSTMGNLRKDFSAIQTLADQQIDLLDQTHNNVEDGCGLNEPRSRSKSNTTASVSGGNRHRNYRYPSGSGGPSLATASGREQVVKLHRQHRHYSFQNIAEKESDDGNDANDCYWRNFTGSVSQRQPQESEVMLRLPLSTLIGRRDAFQREKPERKKNHAAGEEAESGTFEPSGSLSKENSMESSGRFGPTKRSLLIDSNRHDSLEKDLERSQHQHHEQQQQQQSSSSSLSSLTSSQQQQQQQQQQQLRQRHRGHERKEPRITIGDKRQEASPALGDKPFTINTTKDEIENFFGNTNNNNSNHHIQNSKTNDCVSPATGIDGISTNRQQLGPGGNKKDTLPVLTAMTTTAATAAEGKYPRDYGDKFERRESLLAGPPGLEEKELCRNCPIIGQIRSDDEGGGEKGEKEEVLAGKIISDDANKPASGQTRMTAAATTTEEFSIDFDDITLPSSPIPFRGRRDEPAAASREEFSSSFGDLYRVWLG